MKYKTIYISRDGKEFEDIAEAYRYEKRFKTVSTVSKVVDIVSKGFDTENVKFDNLYKIIVRFVNEYELKNGFIIDNYIKADGTDITAEMIALEMFDKHFIDIACSKYSFLNSLPIDKILDIKAYAEDLVVYKWHKQDVLQRFKELVTLIEGILD